MARLNGFRKKIKAVENVMTEKCKNCGHGIEPVLVGNKTEYWHSDNLLEVGASMNDCKCRCNKPEPMQEGAKP